MWMSTLFAVLAATAPTGADGADTLALNPELPLSSCEGAAATVHLSHATSRTIEGELHGLHEANAHVPNDSWCSGYVPESPQHCFIVATPMTVVFEVIDASTIDSVLVLQDEDGALVRCDDDGGMNLLSRIEVPLAAGSYRMSVGSYGQGHIGAYRMTVNAR